MRHDAESVWARMVSLKINSHLGLMNVDTCTAKGNFTSINGSCHWQDWAQRPELGFVAWKTVGKGSILLCSKHAFVNILHGVRPFGRHRVWSARHDDKGHFFISFEKGGLEVMRRIASICIPFLIALFAGGTDVHGQTLTFDWARQIGNPSTAEIGYALKLDAQGNVITTGYFNGTVDFDPGIGTANLTCPSSNPNGFIQKMDNAGNYLWAKHISGTEVNIGYSVEFDSAGNVYVVGTFNGTVDFDPGVGTFNLTATSTNSDIFFLKLSPGGDFIWAKSIGNNLNENCKSIAVDPPGNVYTVGSFLGTIDLDPGTGVYSQTSAGNLDMFMLKLDSTGNFIWARTLGGQGPETAVDIALGLNGTICLTGLFGTLLDFDPFGAGKVLDPNYGINIYVLKLDTNSNYIWAGNYGADGLKSPESIVVDRFGNVISAGRISGTMDFDPGPGTYTVVGSGAMADAYVQKLDSFGNFVWVRTIGAVNPDGIMNNGALAVDNQGSVYFGGNYRGNIDADPGAGVVQLNGNSDMFVIKLDSAGIYHWSNAFSNHAGIDVTQGLYVDGNLNVYGTGQFAGTIDFDPTSANAYLISGNNTYWNVPIFKWGQCYSSFTTLTQASCDSFSLNGATYSSSGTYTQTRTNAGGCDSIITLHLTILTDSDTTLYASTCDSFSLNGSTYTTPGIYTQTLTNAAGCDSILTLDLSILHSSSTITATGCWNYPLNGTTYTSSGTYTQVIPNMAGCDSTITLNLSVVNFTATVSQTGQTLTALPTGSTTSYQWVVCNNYALIPGANNQTFTPSVAGSYAVIVTSDSCTDTSACFVFTPVDVAAVAQANFTVYPNPNRGQFLLDLAHMDFKQYHLSLYDGKGVQLWNETVIGNGIHFIDLETRVAGIYFLHLRDEEKIYAVKLLIQ